MVAHQRKNTFWIIGLAALVVVVVGVAWTIADRVAIRDLERRGRAALLLRSEALSGWLGRFQPLASVYARDPDIVDLLSDELDEASLAHVNARLVEWNSVTGAADTYLLDANGVAVAASNWDEAWSFVGNDYSFRPYFQQARDGRLGRYFALGTQSGKRGYYFAYPVREDDVLLGAMVVKASVDLVEQDLRSSRDEVFVSDASGVIVLAGHPQWRLKSLGALPAATRQAIAKQRQFGPDPLAPVAFDGVTPVTKPLGRFVDVSPDRSSARAQEMMHLTRPMTVENWTLHLLTPTREARGEARASAALAGAVALILLLTAFIGVQRRRRLLDRMRDREAENERMELTVQERTVDLRESNARLAQEVEERRAAEDRLRATQHELIQAAKLAALGQMSTSLSHEFNQPLAAIRAYADNAVAFMTLGRKEDVVDNLGRISKLTQRMAELSRNLTSFARKPKDSIGPTEFGPVLAQSIELLQARLERGGVDVATPRRIDAWVIGGPNRLQQVLINVIGNAIDACVDASAPKIAIAVREDRDIVEIAISDNGPGVPTDLRESVFDPFFTTKDAGDGLGLGLSISYNIVRDFGGVIEIDRSDLGGACFRIRLRAAPATETVIA